MSPYMEIIYVIITAIIQDAIEELYRIIDGKNCQSLHQALNHRPFDSLHECATNWATDEPWEYDTKITIWALQGFCGM